MYTVQVLSTLEEMHSMEPEWNRLLSESDTNIPFLSQAWLSCWWRVFGKGSRLFVLVVREGEEIAAIAPLMKTKTLVRGVPVTAVSFIDDYHSERNGLILKREDPEIGRVLVGFIRASGCDVMMLNLILKDTAADRALREGLAAHGMPHIVREGSRSPTIPVEAGWQQYYQGRSKNFRHKLNRVSNLFNRRGKFEVARYTDRNIERGLKEMADISRKTWKYRNGTAIVNRERNARFYAQLAMEASARGFLNLWVLKYEGRPIAFAYNLEWNKRIFALKIGFDETYHNMSPSEFLNLNAVRDCFERNFLEYEWLGKPLSFKMRWTSVCKEHVKYMAFNSTVRGKLLYSVETRLVPFVKSLLGRKTPAAEGSV